MTKLVPHNCTEKPIRLNWMILDFGWKLLKHNRPISQIPECICAISHNATFCNRNVHMCAHFCYRMVHCGIFVWCIMGFVRWVYYPSTQAAYKTDPTLTDNQTFIYQSEKNKDLFAKTVENKYFSWVPKDPCSKVRTFPENKDPWEPCWCYELV